MKIKIKKNFYKIFFDIKQDVDYFGKTCFAAKEIHLCIFGTKEFLKKVVRHELTHAFLFEYGISPNWLDYNEKAYEEESVCDIVAIYSEDILKLANKICAYFDGVRDAKIR